MCIVRNSWRMLKVCTNERSRSNRGREKYPGRVKLLVVFYLLYMAIERGFVLYF